AAEGRAALGPAGGAALDEASGVDVPLRVAAGGGTSVTRFLLALSALGLTHCSSPSTAPEPPLFDAIARYRAVYDAALDSGEPFRKGLADESWQVRHSALFGLRHCAGPQSPASTVEAVRSCLSDPAVGIRNEAVLALAKIGGPAALDAILTRAVRDLEALVRK